MNPMQASTVDGVTTNSFSTNTAWVFTRVLQRLEVDPANHDLGFFVLTLRPLVSKLVFHLINFILSSSSVSALITRSSAYNNSQGVPVQNSRDKASSSMMNKRGVSTES